MDDRPLATSPAGTVTDGEGYLFGVPNFSLMTGGPLFRLLRTAHLADDALRLLHRRIVLVILVTWVPLAILCIARGDFIAPGRQGFVNDIAFNLRFLVVAPLLIGAELMVHRRMRPIIEQFEVRNLVRADQRPRFQAALAEAYRWRNSVAAEVVLLVIVYAAGLLFSWQRYHALAGDGWYVGADGQGLSPAGWWLVFVSMPLFQFLLLRWYFRLLIWAQFLWRVSRLDLDLEVTHPDRAGGLGFLAASLPAMAPLAAAHGVLFAGMMAAHVFFNGGQITDFKVEVIAGAILLAVLFTGPLLVFCDKLASLKREGLRWYGALGQTYATAFRDRWSAPPRPGDEPFLGSGDIQSLADLGNSYANAEQMRLIPVGPAALIYVAVAFLAPMAPLLLTMVSADELLKRLIGLVF